MRIVIINGKAMVSEEKIRIIEKITNELLEKMGFSAQITISSMVAPESEKSASTYGQVEIDIQMTDSKYLIGKFGANLAALQHLLRIIVRKNIQEFISLNVDINGYRQEQKNGILRIARETAEQVIREQKPQLLRPMNSFERRMVHVELAKITGLKTESIGSGDERKIMISPASLEEELELS